jgi:hypothetical protein
MGGWSWLYVTVGPSQYSVLLAFKGKDFKKFVLPTFQGRVPANSRSDKKGGRTQP